MERKQISDEVLLVVVEASIRSMAEYISKNGRGAFVSTSEAVGALTEALWKVAATSDAGNAGEFCIALFDVMSVCTLAIGGMAIPVRDPNGELTKPVEGIKDAPVDVEISKDLAHKKMLERHSDASGIVITDKLPS